LYALGPLVSEKIIGREIKNKKDRKMDQTPSDGSSVVNRTLCNDDRTKDRSIDVSYSKAVKSEEVDSITKRAFQSYEWERSLKTSVSFYLNVPVAGGTAYGRSKFEAEFG
jgi:hypothetical protein